MKVLITGADGFVGKNLQIHLAERKDVQVVRFTRSHNLELLPELLEGVEFVFHLAGVNRPHDPLEFTTCNANLTLALCQAVRDEAQATGKHVSIIFTSSTQAVHDNQYGKSKLVAEEALIAASVSHGTPVHIFRLPNVFGKWCKPNYNSAVATFCYNVARGLPTQVNDPATVLTLVHVDDVIERFVQLMDETNDMGGRASLAMTGEMQVFAKVTPEYTITLGELDRQIKAFKESRSTLMTERVGTGLVRALYSSYMSYLPTESFSYVVQKHADHRGVFAEMLKTPDCGQFSFFTAHPGVTRGGHYHHNKTEKFMVVKGQARFKFRHVQTGQIHELIISGEKTEIVETVPGWVHDITNIGQDEMVVILWANEVFDHTRPDTVACAV
jgi:UDP-2-acetamido-2,6-beta-L-arabino-hexul-4-ose reductase